MDVYTGFCAFVCLLYFQLASASHKNRCSYTDTRSHIDIARIVGHALTLDEFETYVIDETMLQLYRAIPDGEEVVRTYKYNVRFEKTEEGIYEKYTGFSDGTLCVPTLPEDHVHVDMQMCKRRHVKKATLFYKENDEFIVFFSDCPSSYVLMVECKPVGSITEAVELKKCPIESTFISVFLPGLPEGTTPDDVQLYQIAKDLKKATGIKLGAENWFWSYTFGVDCV